MNAATLLNAGYRIENARIISADLTMEDHGCLTLYMTLEGSGFGCVYGGYCLGHGYLGADNFDGSPQGIEYIMRLMDTVGVSTLSGLAGKYVRIAISEQNTVKIIGNILDERWFDPEKFWLPPEAFRKHPAT